MRGEAPSAALFHPQVQRHQFVVKRAAVACSCHPHQRVGDRGAAVLPHLDFVMIDRVVLLCAGAQPLQVFRLALDDAGRVRVDELVREDAVERFEVALDHGLRPGILGRADIVRRDERRDRKQQGKK